MIGRLVLAMLIAATLSASAGAADDKAGARRLLDLMREAETYMLAGWQVLDAKELDAQSSRLVQATALPQDEIGFAMRSECLDAAASMSNLAGGMARIVRGEVDAKGLVRIKQSYANWKLYLANCETALKSKKPRKLVIELDP